MTDGTLETINGRPALRFERMLTHSVQRVWRASSRPQQGTIAPIRPAR